MIRPNELLQISVHQFCISHRDPPHSRLRPRGQLVRSTSGGAWSFAQFPVMRDARITLSPSVWGLVLAMYWWRIPAWANELAEV